MKRVVPPGATVAVVSKGDDALLELDGRAAWHFPGTEEGSYLGYYPQDGLDAIALLEQVAQRGADYFVLPSSAFWWLEHYPELNRHLREERGIIAGEESCLVFGLSDAAVAAAPAQGTAPVALGEAPTTPVQALTRALLPREAITAVLALDGGGVALEGARVWRLPRKPAGSLVGHLEALIASRAEFLVVPRDELEWLGRQSELAATLERHHRLVTRQRHVCAIYELTAGPATAENGESATSDAVPALRSGDVGRRSLVGRLLAALRSGGGDGS